MHPCPGKKKEKSFNPRSRRSRSQKQDAPWTAVITVTDFSLINLFKFFQNAFQAHVSPVPSFKPQNSSIYEEHHPITTDK